MEQFLKGELGEEMNFQVNEEKALWCIIYPTHAAVFIYLFPLLWISMMSTITAPEPLDGRYYIARKLLNKWGFSESNEMYFPYRTGSRREE